MSVATPRLAATILLLRDGPAGAEIGLVLRNKRIAFAGGALVYPGGSVDESDRATRVCADGADDIDDDALALRAAAVREAFEECGVLLARRGAAMIEGRQASELLQEWRPKLEAREAGIADLASAAGLTLALDRLHPFAHWITPEAEAKRFDTHFFVAKAPEDHALSHDGGEAVGSVWRTPAQAMDEARAGAWALMFPTWLTLKALEGAATADEAIARAAAHPKRPVMPELSFLEGGAELRIPADAGYGHAAFRVKGLATEPQPI